VNCVFEITPQELAVLVVLLAGHVFGDFLFQSQRVADAKEKSGAVMLAHGGLVLVAHLAVLAPVWTWRAAGLMTGLSVLHTAVDAVRARVRGGASLQAFAIDQTAHVALVVLAWLWLMSGDGWLGEGMTEGWFRWYARVLAVASAYVFNGKGGTAIVRKTLSRYPRISGRLESDGLDEYEMGRVIGTLERLLVLTLILFWQWAAIGLVIAAKSIARFPELRDRRHKEFTEYYLIGTLTSILVAVGSAIMLKGVLSCF